MRKNILKPILSALLIVSVLGACTSEFEEMNIDPNSASSVPTAYLMTQAQRSAIDEIDGSLSPFMAALYCQHWSQTQYTSTSRYETEIRSFNSFYYSSLADFEEIIRLNTDEATKLEMQSSGPNHNQIAVARIMKAYEFQNITDTWGDVPYSEALQGRGDFTPAYDTQKDIYTDLVKEVKEAVAQIEVGEPIAGDIIFEGDMAMWKKFGNALLMRMGLRMSEVDAAAAKAAIEAGMAGAISSNDDNALFPYLADANNWNPIYDHFVERTDYAISDIMVDVMKGLSDPRLDVYADPNDAGEIVGMPYGVSDDIAGSITNASISFPGAAVRGAESKGLIMTYAEVLFIKAEAAARGMIAGDPKALYEEAIAASFDQWGVDMPAGYLTQADVAYDAANPVESIINQKWIALYMQGMEGWSDFRRTGYPELSPAPAAAAGRSIPNRRAYTNDEYSLNEENVVAAVARQGADDMATKMWWQK
ncbi:SusD/RagB family nutrient-binding outer membrane lipoprotein [Flammeovirgaceae bacterium SG7u.111]|nr:SusD/RagB family nutrient-binding outer membrane lipoprotein [Flammeovirgaceae bacterium SG7u.132]WPO37007.1 SusD/RagB family nutrient-binding outer membrane lipoprotein [Flammeovirgaceae bacterium SG7u.111]